MHIRKGYKYRLKANRSTCVQFVRFAGACRFVWNKILAINEHRYYAGVPRLSYAQACELLAWWKQSEEYGWLKDVHSQVLQQCVRDLERAYTNLFVTVANPNCSCEAIPYSCRPKTSWPSTIWTLIIILSCRARYAGSFASPDRV